MAQTKSERREAQIQALLPRIDAARRAYGAAHERAIEAYGAQAAAEKAAEAALARWSRLLDQLQDLREGQA